MRGEHREGRVLTSQRRRIRVGTDHELVVEHLEGASPPYVYLHGLGSTKQGQKSEALFASARRRGRAAWRFDFRGHGESSGRIEDLALSDLLLDAESVLAITGPSILVGSSLGGLVAAWTAVRQPGLVRSLCLIAPAFGFLDRHAARPRPDGHFVITSQWTNVRIHERALEDARKYDETSLAGSISVPTLVVHGERDETVPAAVSERFFGALTTRDKHLWIVPGGDHRLNTFVEPIFDLVVRHLG